MMQVIEQTDEEKLAMYMKLDKEELAKMLIEANKHIMRMGPIVISGQQLMDHDLQKIVSKRFMDMI